MMTESVVEIDTASWGSELFPEGRSAIRSIPPETQEEAAKVVAAALTSRGVSARLEKVWPDQDGSYRLVIPQLRMFVPAKELSRSALSVLLAAAADAAFGGNFVQDVVAASVAVLADKVRLLSGEELSLVRFIISSKRANSHGVTTAYIESNWPGVASQNLLESLKEKGVLRERDGSWMVNL